MAREPPSIVPRAEEEQHGGGWKETFAAMKVCAAFNSEHEEQRYSFITNLSQNQLNLGIVLLTLMSLGLGAIF